MSAATGQGGDWDTIARSHQQKAEDLLRQAANPMSANQAQALAARAQAHATLALIDTLEYQAAIRAGAVQ